MKPLLFKYWNTEKRDYLIENICVEYGIKKVKSVLKKQKKENGDEHEGEEVVAVLESSFGEGELCKIL